MTLENYGVIGIELSIALLLTVGMIFYSLKKKKYKRVSMLGIIATALILGLSVVAVKALPLYEEYKFEQARIAYYEEHYDEIYDKFVDSLEDIEYGDEYKITPPEGFILQNSSEVDTMKVGKQEIVLEALDVLGYPVTFEYEVNIVDTQKPKIEGVKDLTLEYGDKFDVDKLEITASDPVDGDLKVSFDGEVDTQKAGKYEIKVIAEDENENNTTEAFKVTVNPKPQPKPTVNTSGSKNTNTSKPQNNTQQNQSIKFANGKTVVYYNHGSATGQRTIDNNIHVATTWDILHYRKTHSGTDDAPTYLAGHENGAFSHLKNVKHGEVITVKDHNGNSASYKVTSIYQTWNSISSSGKSTIPSQETLSKLNAFTGEGIMFQVCVNGNILNNLIIEARPV